MDEDPRFEEHGEDAPGDDEHASSAGIEVDERLNIESIELNDDSGAFVTKVRASTGEHEPSRHGRPNGERHERRRGFSTGSHADEVAGGARTGLERLEEEHLELAAELARLRADAAAREELLGEELKRLRGQLAEREQELSDQVAQIASLTLTCDGLRSRLAERDEDEHKVPAPGTTAAHAREPNKDERASLMARLEERANALKVAREEIEELRSERDRLAEALTERGEQVSQLLGQVTRAEVRNSFGMDFRSGLRRLLGRDTAHPAADARPVSAGGGPGEEPTIVVGDGASGRAAASASGRPGKSAVAQEVCPAPRRKAEQQPRLQRFLLSLDGQHDEVFEIRKPRCYVGRGVEADVRIVHETTSRLHAVLYQLGGATIVEDACSMNGVFVNRQRVHQAALQDGDTVAFGSARYQFRIGSDPSRDH